MIFHGFFFLSSFSMEAEIKGHMPVVQPLSVPLSKSSSMNNMTNIASTRHAIQSVRNGESNIPPSANDFPLGVRNTFGGEDSLEALGLPNGLSTMSDMGSIDLGKTLLRLYFLSPLEIQIIFFEP
jgi:hypothetical protein